MNRLIFS